MRQVLQDARSGEITVEEVPAPQVLPGCVLVRVAASVVSAGTERASAEFARKSLLQKAKSRPDLVKEVISKVQRDGILSAVHAVRSRLDQPQSPGYSSAGTVITLGEGVTDLQPGDRVACAGAGFAVHADFACVPRLLLARIPARNPLAGGEVPFDQAAFTTLGSVALHGIRTAEAKLGDMVAVIGLGLLGQLTVQMLKAAGCHVLGMDINASRTKLAERMGADGVAASASAFQDLCLQASHGAGVDCVLIAAETSSSDPVNLAGAVARDRAVVVAVGTVGMDIERKAFYEKELDFRLSRSYGPGRYDSAYEQKGRDYPVGYVRWTETRNMEAFVQMLGEGKVNVAPLITHRFSIARAQRAYELITGKLHEPFLGVVLQYGEDGSASPTLRLEPRSGRATRVAPPTAATVGLLGAGGFACSTLIPAMKASPYTSLITVCAATGSHSKHAGSKFEFRRCTTEAADLLKDADINTVVIATRHHLHARQVVSALGAGKNVFCEKPLCLSEEELRNIVSAYTEIPMPRRPTLMVGFNRRFAPMVVQMKSFLAPVREPLALHYRINGGYLPPDHWINDREHGGGRVLGEVCHFVDLLMFVAGSPVVEVMARGLGTTSRYSGDNVLVSLRFANGSEGTISYLANGDRSFSKERIEIFGGGSTAVLDDFRRLDLVRNGRTQTIRSRWRQDKGHHAEWAAFVDCIRLQKDLPISFEDMVCSTLATLRLEESRAAGEPMAVDLAGFLEDGQTGVLPQSNLHG
ncbi:MAG TPA: bi-domain-containing oxidoreductase [Candidatus Sulfotelmatobacter sp.]|nr:bi-domain-containing oxidoreductase [Candidatus Sulfotelmatobacter sp.]